MIRVLAFFLGGAAGALVGYHFLLDTFEHIGFRLWREDKERGFGFFDLDTVLRSSTTWKLVGPMLLFGLAAVVLVSFLMPRKKRRR